MNVPTTTKSAAFIVIVVWLAVTGPMQAAVITTADGNGADTYGSNDDNSGPADIHGTEESANLRSLITITSSGPPDFEDIVQGVRARVALLRFDLTTASVPANARLRLVEIFGRRDRTIQIYGLNDGPGDNWDEEIVNYSNMPGVDNGAELGTYAVDANETTLLGEMAVIDNRIDGVETPQSLLSDPSTLPLDDFIAQDTNGLITLLLTYDPLNTDSNPDYLFATKENPTYAPPALVPEPAAVLLAALSLISIGLGLNRQRRPT